MYELLPNSIPSNRKVDWSISRADLRWLYLYCANCGADGGRVLETSLSEQFAFYLCNDCAETHGAIDGTYMVPDEVFWEKVRWAQIEEHGRILSPLELAIQLQDESSLMSKLKKENQ